MTHTTAALFIFALTYSVIAIGKFPWLQLDRAGAAFAGAVAMVVCGAISEDAARDAIDYRTLALLLGMMIVVANLRLSGAFTTFARSSAQCPLRLRPVGHDGGIGRHPCRVFHQRCGLYRADALAD